MMKGNAIFKWMNEGNKEFNEIKFVLADALMLSYPNFTKDFNIYCYDS